MKTRKIYNTPAIEEIRLDNEISLQLASVEQNTTPPGDPQSVGRMRSDAPESDPYQYDNW